MGSRTSEALASSLVTGINLAMARLVDIWDSIGIMEDQRIERMQTVKKCIEDLLTDMISEEESMRHRIKTSIITTRKQLEKLCFELSVEPYKVEEDLTVLQVEKNLRCHLETLQKEKSERLKELSELAQQDEELCVPLCTTPYYIPTGSVPSHKQLQELREHIRQLSEEKESRVKVFSGLREDIRSLMDEMGHEAETSLEQECVCPDTDIFLLTHDNIRALKLLLSQLEMKKESLVSSRDSLKDRAMTLWNRLSCPDEEAEEFNREPQNVLRDDIRKWQGVVDRLELLQKTKLEEVIDKVRQELVALWDKCMFGPEQREPFSVHFCDANYTVELLNLHDCELLKVKEFYEKARPLLESIEKWQKNWALFLDFERKAADPNRFSNRGGALLKESKDRAKVQKLLPKMSKKADSTQFKTPNKRPHGAANTSVTPSKMRKTPNQLLLRTNMISSSTSSMSSTFVCVPGKPPISAKRVKTSEASSAPRTPLQEFNSDKNLDPFSYSDFTHELSRKAHHDAVMNSTVKDVVL
ncbi:protein regulator of cytokinesis 1 isoform X3 [Neoarius graeffei]|uniref:protein regulator of cytokinesis 1 isoform X3 n=1 Tax=Neoarius graeffei TaxID=443677 RepID=UPI00298D075C|nr:protein regulator of cytokinesis 1 isoform X3 [Neoarius graeffei]